MGQYAKMHLAAKIMLIKWGKAAATIAALRARRSARRNAEDAVKAWTAVARAASSAPSRRKTKSDASLDDLLAGEVTRQVMAADRVEPGDVELLMQRTKRHRRSSGR
jgi:hypothetical protein